MTRYPKSQFKYIQYLIYDNLLIDDKNTFDVHQVDEEEFDTKILYLISINALSQAIDQSFDMFIIDYIRYEKMFPSCLIPKLLINSKHSIVDKIVEKSDVYPYELKYFNAFHFEQASLDSYFYPLSSIKDDVKVIKDKKVILSKNIVYYVYRNSQLSLKERQSILSGFFEVCEKDPEPTFNCLLMMKDQDLAECPYKQALSNKRKGKHRASRTY